MKTLLARKTYGKPVTEEVREEAIVRGKQRSIAEPHATALRYLKRRSAIELDFADGTAITLPIEKYDELAPLSEDDRERLALGFGGSVLCLEERDLHVSIAGLVAASKSLKEVAAAVAGVRAVVSFTEPIKKGGLGNRKVDWIFNQINSAGSAEIEYLTNALGVSEEKLTKALQGFNEIRKTKQKDADTGVAKKKGFRPA